MLKLFVLLATILTVAILSPLDGTNQSKNELRGRGSGENNAVNHAVERNPRPATPIPRAVYPIYNRGDPISRPGARSARGPPHVNIQPAHFANTNRDSRDQRLGNGYDNRPIRYMTRPPFNVPRPTRVLLARDLHVLGPVRPYQTMTTGFVSSHSVTALPKPHHTTK